MSARSVGAKSSLLWRRPLTPQVRQRQGNVFSLWAWQQWGLIAAFSTGPARTLSSQAGLRVCAGLGRYEETQITANTRNAFPPGGLWRLGGREEKKTGVSPGCQTRDVFWLGPGWHVQTNKEEAGVLRTRCCRCPVRHLTTAGACRENR